MVVVKEGNWIGSLVASISVISVTETTAALFFVEVNFEKVSKLSNHVDLYRRDCCHIDNRNRNSACGHSEYSMLSDDFI